MRGCSEAARRTSALLAGGSGSRAWGSKHCRGWEGSWSNRSSQRSRTKCHPPVNQTLPIPKMTFWLSKHMEDMCWSYTGSCSLSWCDRKRDLFVINSDALLVHLICNAIKMAISICIWACAIVLNRLNSHVNQWNGRRALAAPVTCRVSHLEQSVQRGANGRTALLCLIDNEPLTSIILFQSGPATIQGVCMKWRFLPLRLSLNHRKALVNWN